MIAVPCPEDFATWRAQARGLLARGVEPWRVDWNGATDHLALFAREEPEAVPEPHGGLPSTPCEPPSTPRVPAIFPEWAGLVAAHSSPGRWALLYRVLWRLTIGGERRLLGIPTDPDIHAAQAMQKAVRRDIHKMHAFVRFRRLPDSREGGREAFAAWYEPDHHIVGLAAPFFRKRFASMDWSIFTPKGCVSWDGGTLSFSPGIPKAGVPAADATEDLWLRYFRGIFQPTRLNPRAMRSEMPKKSWKNLPEAAVIDELIRTSPQQVQSMFESAPLPPKPRGPGQMPSSGSSSSQASTCSGA